MRCFETLSTFPRAYRRAISYIPFGAGCHCNICNRRVQRFLPYRGGLADVPAMIRQLDVIGSDVENYECPNCGCHDRERHLLMYLIASGELIKMNGAKILHLAPERHLQRFIRGAMPIEYVRADLYPDQPGVDRIDLHAVPYPAEYFDFVLANHVLEHVNDDLLALHEVYRILRFGGRAILQTPYSNVLTRVFEDPGIASVEARLQAYGQEDHCRLYGKNISQRFETVGLRSLMMSHRKILNNIDPIKWGVNINEPFFLFEKSFNETNKSPH